MLSSEVPDFFHHLLPSQLCMPSPTNRPFLKLVTLTPTLQENFDSPHFYHLHGLKIRFTWSCHVFLRVLPTSSNMLHIWDFCKRGQKSYWIFILIFISSTFLLLINPLWLSVILEVTQDYSLDIVLTSTP